MKRRGRPRRRAPNRKRSPLRNGALIIGLLAEVCREAGHQAPEKHIEKFAPLKDELARFETPDGVIMKFQFVDGYGLKPLLRSRFSASTVSAEL